MGTSWRIRGNGPGWRGHTDLHHLIDTYIEADQPRTISPFEGMGLMEVVVRSGIADAIASQLGALKGDKKAIAETIENNVRKTIVKEHLSDPAFYDRMSAVLDEIIARRKDKALEYEEYLKEIADLAKRVHEGVEDDMPPELKRRPALHALFNNLRAKPGPNTADDRVSEPDREWGKSEEPILEVARRIDKAVRRARPDDWRGVQAREQAVKRALYEILQDESEVERIFLVVKARSEY